MEQRGEASDHREPYPRISRVAGGLPLAFPVLVIFSDCISGFHSLNALTFATTEANLNPIIITTRWLLIRMGLHIGLTTL